MAKLHIIAVPLGVFLMAFAITLPIATMQGAEQPSFTAADEACTHALGSMDPLDLLLSISEEEENSIEGLSLLQRAATVTKVTKPASAARVAETTEEDATEGLSLLQRAATTVTASAGRDAVITDEFLEPSCIIIFTLMISLISFSMWHFSVKASGSKDITTASGPISKEGDDVSKSCGDRGALSWLAALVATSFLLLIFQLGAGFSTGALTLIADSAHTAADTVSYAFNWFVERAKCSTGVVQSEKAQRATARFDALSAVFSVAIVLGTSVCATADALRRLRSGPAVGTAGASTEGDLTLIGPALLGFAILSTATNVGLLALHRRRESAAKTASAPNVPASPPLPTAVPPPPAPPPVELEDASVPPPPVPHNGPGATGRPGRANRERTARRGAQIAWLHQAFHPGGCNSEDCTISHDAVISPSSDELLDNSADKAVAALGSTLSAEPGTDNDTNLNLYGAVLHLITDVVRSLVIFAVAILVQTGVIRDAATADAICAVAVSACIVLGSVALLRTAVAALCGRRAPKGTASAAPVSV